MSKSGAAKKFIESNLPDTLTREEWLADMARVESEHWEGREELAPDGPGAVQAVSALEKDIRKSAALSDRRRARFLLRLYYQIQDVRQAMDHNNTDPKRHKKKPAKSDDVDEPTKKLPAWLTDRQPDMIATWLAQNCDRLERTLIAALNEFVKQYRIGNWMLSIDGMGPVVAAGMLASFDVRGCKTAGHFWRFAGLDPSIPKREKGALSCYSDAVKVLCYHLSGAWVKMSKRKPDSPYVAMYLKRKALEVERNLSGANRERALADLDKYKSANARRYCKQGLLPQAQIQARSRRYAVKMFLSHLHTMMYRDYYQAEPPVPFSFEHCDGDHRHYIAPPNADVEFTGASLRELLTCDKCKRYHATTRKFRYKDGKKTLPVWLCDKCRDDANGELPWVD